MIRQIRELTGLSHQKLGAWLGLSRTMVQFAEDGNRSLQGDASKKLVLLAPVIEQLVQAAKKPAAPPAFTDPAAFAKAHKDKASYHSGQAARLQYQLTKLAEQHARLGSGLVLFNAMKNINSSLYSSTEADAHTAGLLEFFNEDKLKRLVTKMEQLQDKIEIHRGYAEVHTRRRAHFEKQARR